MKPNGLLETALYVGDLDVSKTFYQRLFSSPILLVDERMCALKIVDTQILLLFKIGASTKGEAMPGGFIPPHDGRGQLHLAFSISLEDVAKWREHLKQHEVEIESEVEANDGHSIYFRDPDGHCIELGTPGLWNIED